MKIFCPLENSAKFKLNWIQIRPKITQKFGADFARNGQFVYRSLGLKGHNGLDLKAKIGTQVFAPLGGVVEIGNEGNSGYGKFVKIRNAEHEIEVVLAHFSQISAANNSTVEPGDRVGLTGSTGLSTGPHIHIGLRFLVKNGENIFDWSVKNHENGFAGYIDPTSFLTTWKGDFAKTSLAD